MKRIDATHGRCPQCGKVLPVGAFPRSVYSANGRQTYCQDCRNRDQRRRRAARDAATGASARTARLFVEDLRAERKLREEDL